MMPSERAVALFKTLDALVLRGPWLSATRVIQEALDAERASVWEEAAEIIETMWPGHKTLGVPHSLAESFRARAAVAQEGTEPPECCLGSNPACAGGCLVERSAKQREADLASAQEAIRLAAERQVHFIAIGEIPHRDGFSPDCAGCQWLAHPAVKAALEEKP